MNQLDHEQIEHLLKETTVHFSRSGGKGGQNVNKVETRVELVFNIAHSQVLDETAKSTLLEVLKNKLDHEGNLHITASTERLQHANRRLAEQKLVRLIKNALTPAVPRLKTKPSKASKIARLYSKRKQSMKKKERRSTSDD